MGVFDSYSESNQDNDASLYAGVGYQGVGQSITGTGGQFNKTTWYISKQGSPTGNITSYIYAHSGTFGTSSIPTGSALATSNTVNISTLTTSLTLTDFTFASPYTMSAGTKYVVTIEYNGGDNTNNLRVGYDNSSPSHSGNMSTLFSASWGDEPTQDAVFYAYEAGTGNATTAWFTG